MIPCKICNGDTELVRLTTTAGWHKCGHCGNINIIHYEEANEEQNQIGVVQEKKQGGAYGKSEALLSSD